MLVQHNRWSYLKYLLYLREKDNFKMTGLERYILKKWYSKERVDWLPQGRAWCLEKQDRDHEQKVEMTQ